MPVNQTLKKIILVRHGQAENNSRDLVGGWSQVKLTKLGVKQVKAVAKRLSKELKGTYTLYSSDLTRAKQTTEILSKTLNMESTYAMELREFNSGIASGMVRKEAMKHYDNTSIPTLDWRPYPESESWKEFNTRVTSFLNKLSKTEERVIIVSHGGTIQIIIKWWLGIPLTDFFNVAFRTANTGVTVLVTTTYLKRGVHSIERLNDTLHYSEIGMIDTIP